MVTGKKSIELLVSRQGSFSVDSSVAGKHLFLDHFLGLILLGFLKLNILSMTPGFRVFPPIPKLTRISAALNWCSQILNAFWTHNRD